MINKKKISNKGFSLVELLVVVAIIGVLAGTGIVGYQSYTEATKLRVFKANVGTIIKAINFEIIVAQNSLGSAIKEFDKDDNMIDEDGDITTVAGQQKNIDGDTTCSNFLFSMMAHFEKDGTQVFNNPWKKEWRSITIDTQAEWQHRKGQIQLVCYVQWGSFGNGGGCPLSSDAMRMIVISSYKDRLNRHYSGNTNCNGEWAGDFDNNEALNSSCGAMKFIGGIKRASNADAQADCGNPDDFYIQHDTIRADAGGAI